MLRKESYIHFNIKYVFTINFKEYAVGLCDKFHILFKELIRTFRFFD